MLADVCEHVDIDTRAGHHRQDLACRRLDRNDTADLVAHQPLAVLLELRINRGDDIFAGDGFLVHFAVHIGVLDLVVGVAQVDMIALLPAQVILPRRLDAGLAGIVAGAVFPRVFLDVVRIDLGDIAQQVSAGIERIVADGTHLTPETGELVLQLRKLHISRRRDLLEHHDRLVTDAAPVLAVFRHLLPDEVDGDIQRLRQLERIESLYLPRRHEDVIGDRVADDDLAVAVVDDAARGIDHVIDHRVVGGVPLILVIQDLDDEQLDDQDADRDAEADQEPGGAGVGHRSWSLVSRVLDRSSESSHPATRDTKKRIRLKWKGRVAAPSAQM